LEGSLLSDKLLDKERKTAYQIWEALFPALHPLDIPLGISEILSYLDVLQEEQKVTIHTMEGLDYYGKR
jgi:hypothetical protein